MTKVIDILEAQEIEHSSTGASSAHRWMNCAGSNQLIAKLDPKNRRGAGIDAATGTAAHTLLSQCLETGAEPWEFMGTFIGVKDWTPFEVDQNMVDAVSVAYEHIRDIIIRYPEAEFFVERPLRHPRYPKELFGTCDFALFDRDSLTLFIVDYKHGINVNVEPDSVQLSYYAKLFLADVLQDFPLEELMRINITVTIIQPRQPHPKGPVRSATHTVKDLSQWFQRSLLPALSATQESNAPLAIGDWCKFCAARNHCPALKSEVANLDVTLNPEVLTGEEIGVILQKAEAIRKYLQKLEEAAFNMAKRGEKIPGYKLVRKKSNRVWKEGATDALIEKYGDAMYQDPALKTPPMVEKDFDEGKNLVARWAYSPDNGLTLAPDSDKRVEAKPVLDEFMDRVDVTDEVPADL